MCLKALWLGLLLLPTGPQTLTFHSPLDGTDQPYALYLPPKFDPALKYPLVISLHGEDEDYRLNLRRVFGKGNLLGETEMEAARRFPKLPDVEFIVASPLARGTIGYQGIAEADIYAVLADIRKRFPIDDDRVYLTGLAMGGGGALTLGLTRPDVWAAIAPICPEAPEEARRFAPNALNVPVHLFHGTLDPVVPAESSRRWQHDLLQTAVAVEYTEYPKVRHNAWDVAYKNASIFAWFAQFQRNRFPDRVRFVSDRYEYNSAYWVEFDGLTPGLLASIDARVTRPNQLVIRTGNLDGFSLKLEGHPKYRPDRPLNVIIDDVRLRPSRAVSFTKSGKAWRTGRYQPQANSKHRGAEGPLARALDSAQIYVYGTSGSPSSEELNSRREQAITAAHWSAVHFRVLSDKEVSRKDLESSNLILFGTKETNELIGALQPQLPMSLNVSAADFGLAFIFPNHGHYVLINSGLPWWTGAEQRPGPAFIPEKLRALQGLGDYILFRGSLDEILAEGRFGRDWQLPADAADRIRRTGAVEVKTGRAGTR